MERDALLRIFRSRDIEWYVKSYFLQSVKDILREPMPESAFAKFLTAGKEYGDFNLAQDWMEELRQEIYDGTFYQFLHMHKSLLDAQKDHPTLGWSDVSLQLIDTAGLEKFSPPHHDPM